MTNSVDKPFVSADTEFVFEYEVRDNKIVRILRNGDDWSSLSLRLAPGLKRLTTSNPKKAWWLSRLRSCEDFRTKVAPSQVLRVVDLFSGCGGMSFGLKEAAAQLGIELDFRLAADTDATAAEVYKRNLSPKYFLNGNVDKGIDYRLVFRGESTSLAYPPELEHPLLRALGSVDIVIGGPPCRGYSNLNNRTRRSDDRNSLYLTVPAIGITLSARIIIIENVLSVLHSKPNVVIQAKQILSANGYGIDEVILDATKYGVAQTRKRHFLIAVRDRALEILGIAHTLETLENSEYLTVDDAIGDLEKPDGDSPFDTPASISDENKRRIDFMFENGLYNLPNSERPECHKAGHTYPSVYGRLHKDEPAGTITGGFLSPGRGRFTHYSQRRGLTPHEGARIQGFPDFYKFEVSGEAPLDNKSYSRLIGDAVPPPMAAAVALGALLSTNLH
ncbi:MAG: DNA cytosine methyltransferase [Albidovulum sp.]|nr:DNA cytosine methyltransferase [Albidovulum sp.]